MKVAVCIGGQLRVKDEELKLTIDVFKDAFPDADFFFEVWEGDAKERPEMLEYMGGTVHVFGEYDIDYHPYEDNRDAVDTRNFRKKLLNPNPTRHLHQTKMILNHSVMNKTYLRDYDVVVRSRYDSMVSPTHSFDSYIKMCYTEQCVMSFLDLAYTEGKIKFFHEYGLHEHNTPSYMVFDSGAFMYPAKIWNSDLVTELHNNKKLLAAEFGWYQVLIKPTKPDYYLFDGCAKLSRTIRKPDMKILKELMK
jgi:hypothetical protein